MKSIFLFSFFGVLLGFSGFSQNPGNTCATAQSLSVNSTCITTNVNMSSPTYTTSSGYNAGCGGTVYYDGWYKFTTSATTTSVQLTETAAGSHSVSVWASCSTTSLITCSNVTGAGGGTNNISLTSLSPSTTYYILIQKNFNSSHSGTICLVDNSPVFTNPSNTCTGAPPNLTVNASCVTISYTMSSPTFTFTGVTPSCAVAGSGSNTFDGWYSFVATSATLTIDETANQNRTLAVWTACSSGTELACSYATSNNPNTINLTGLSVGTTYYVQICIRNNVSNTLNGTICISNPPVPDDPWPGMSLGTLTCPGVTSVSNTTALATIDCSTSSAGDHMYQFTTTSNSDVSIELCGSSYDSEIRLYKLSAGDCGGTPDATNDDGCGVQSLLNISCLAAGTYVLVIEGSGTATGAYVLNINVADCGCGAIANNTPCTATSLTVNTSCVNTAGTTNNAGPSGIATPSPGCAGYSDNDDVWYSVVVPASGYLIFAASSLSNSGGMAIYRGTCGNPVFISCTASSNSPNIQTGGLIPGETIYIRLWRTSSNSSITFNICVYEPDCSANTTNDYCEDAATLTANPSAVFGSATAALYTYDNPGGVESIFCGTIQNNSWYAFVATATTASFPITSVTGCGNGIQAQVYSFNTASSCCLNPVARSNCYNPGNTTLGTVNATGLTVGETYYLMIDGWAGANCDFTISGWSATGVLPIKLIEFTGFAESRMNRLKWRTASEINSDVIVVQKSEDGINFTAIGSVKGAGNSTTGNTYSFDDYEVNHTLAYYRLKQIDFDGTFEYSKTISVVREGKLELYPNPTNGDITVKFADAIENDWTITFTDLYGRNVTSSVERINASSNQLVFATDALKKGYYFVKVLNGSGEQIFNNSFIKE